MLCAVLRVAVRRLAQLVPILFGLSLVVFAWIRALPGGPAEALVAEDPAATAESVAAIRRFYGVDRPVHEQYFSYVGQLARLDLGHSISTRQPVTEELRRRFPATVELAVAAALFAVCVGVPLGLVAARRRGSWLDNLSMGTALVGVSVPAFFLAFLLKYVFAVKLGWLPSAGRLDVTRNVAHPTGFYLVDAFVTLDWATLVDAVRHLVLPALALGAVPLAFIARITRAAVLDVLGEEYVRTARAKGVPEPLLSRRHVLRTAMLPVTTTIGLAVGFLLTGAVLVEIVFAWGGMGSLLEEAIARRDYPLLQGGILLVTVVFVVVNLIVDLAYAVLDPRVRPR